MTEAVSERQKLRAEEARINAEEARLVGEDPFRLVENGFLTIKTKKDGLNKLEPNFIQRKFLKSVKEVFYSGKPLRVLVLKARQVGLSTIIESIIYAFTSRMSGINSCVIADDLPGANYIFEMQKLYQEYLEDHLKPVIRHSNEKKMAFDSINSQILIDTADNQNLGRKFTFQFVHCSEVSRWPKSLSEIMSGLGHAVPFSAGTMIFLETTANGYEEFYEMWIKAINGANDWVPLFYPWFENPDNRLALEGGKLYPIDNIKFATPLDKENFLKEERRLQKEYGLTDEQMNWRRWDIVNNCSGDMSKFNEDNPACWQDAFQATGNTFFDKSALKMQKVEKYKALINIVKDNGRYIPRESSSGIFRIYEFPYKGGQYVVAGDPAEGLEDRDKSAAVVLDKKTNRTVATYNLNTPPDMFENHLVLLGYFYNNAMIACENKGYGYSVNQGLWGNYGNVYRRVKTKKGFKEQTLEIGWNTNTVTRPTMLAQMAEEVSNCSTDLLDIDLIGQCWTFINNPKTGKSEAEKGKSDDLVMARAIAGMVRQEHPHKDKFIGNKRKKHYRGLSGY